jgi:hypothetical protein
MLIHECRPGGGSSHVWGCQIFRDAMHQNMVSVTNYYEGNVPNCHEMATLVLELSIMYICIYTLGPIPLIFLQYQYVCFKEQVYNFLKIYPDRIWTLLVLKLIRWPQCHDARALQRYFRDIVETFFQTRTVLHTQDKKKCFSFMYLIYPGWCLSVNPPIVNVIVICRIVNVISNRRTFFSETSYVIWEMWL